MTESKNTKRALYASVISMLLCVTMLIGSTFAWFTDTVTTGVNTIQAGTLDIDLVDKDGTSLVGQTVKFVDDEGNALADNYLWEPGCRVLLQKVGLKNNGNLHAKYKVVISGTTGDVDLAEVIDVYEGETKLGTLRSFLDKAEGVKEGNIAPGETLYFDELKLVMQESADNNYQGKSISDIAITVYATQATVENDSFDNTYDKDAEYHHGDIWDGTTADASELAPNGTSTNNGVGDGKERSLVQISTAEQLAELAVLVNAGNKYTDTNFELANDIDLANIEWTPIGNSTSTPFGGNFNGNGYTIYNLKVSSGDYAGLFGYIQGTSENYQPSISDLTVANVTITGATNAGAIAGGAKYTSRNAWYGGVQVYEDITIIGDVKIEGENVGGILGSDWLDVRVTAKNIKIDVRDGSYIEGNTVAGGVFASLPHSSGVSDVVSNIDVLGNDFVGGIAGNGGWKWDKITCTGDVSLTTTKSSPYSIGTIFGQIADNTYWVSSFSTDNIETYDDLIAMTNLTATGTLTVNETIISNGFASNMIGSAKFTKNTFNYVDGKVVAVTE